MNEAVRSSTSDTQWPRFEVFVQERLGAPYEEAGSVHAPDPELALMNARDVFARRPECFSMWVVPANIIFSRTAEELDQPGALTQTSAAEAQAQTYYIACKRKPAGTVTVVGSLEAVSPQEALRMGLEQFSGEAAPFVWWVFPSQQVYSSEPEDVASLYAPAREKRFRFSTDFRTVSAMRSIRSKEPNRQENGQSRGGEKDER